MIAAISIETYREIERRVLAAFAAMGIKVDQELYNRFCYMLLEHYERHGKLPEVKQ